MSACSSWALVIGAAALLACGDNAGSSAPDASIDAPPDELTIATDRGALVGTDHTGVRAFLGIPYAAAPVGALRWKAPTESRWTRRDAKQLGPRCVSVDLLAPNTPRADTSEDCLSLNIWAPARAAHLPVLFWIHGGGFVDGSGGDYPGEALARAGKIVVVTINYRLGALGTLAIPSADGGGNLGLLDQQFALQWVHRNIAAFGGDPTKVTLAGQSAGAEAACIHAAMPSSRDLFSALLLESGTCDVTTTPAAASAAATAMATAWGCAPGGALDEACLRALPAETVVRGNSSAQVGPIIDGTLLPTSPRAAMAAGGFAKVPVLAGFNADEGLFFTDSLYAGIPLATADDYSNALGLLFGPLGAALAQQYPLADYNSDPRLAFAALIRDGFQECPTRNLVAAVAASSPAFAYQFRYAPSLTSPKPVGAMHTAELPFVWGIPLPWIWWTQANAGLPTTARERELATQMQAYWTSFVATHDPATTTLPAWPAWTASAPSAIAFGDTTASAALPGNAHCAFWDFIFGPQATTAAPQLR